MITIGRREPRKADGRVSIPRPYLIDQNRIAAVPLAEDREVLALLLGGGAYDSFGYYPPNSERGSNTFSLAPMIAQTLLPRIVRTGRCFLSWGKNESEGPPLRWDDGEPWRFLMKIDGSVEKGWRMEGAFRRGSEKMSIDQVVVETRSGFLITREHVARLANDGGLYLDWGVS